MEISEDFLIFHRARERLIRTYDITRMTTQRQKRKSRSAMKTPEFCRFCLHDLIELNLQSV